MYENQDLLRVLRPKGNQFVREVQGEEYRPRSTMHKQRERKLTTQDGVDSQSSKTPSQRGQSKRRIYLNKQISQGRDSGLDDNTPKPLISKARNGWVSQSTQPPQSRKITLPHNSEHTAILQQDQNDTKIEQESPELTHKCFSEDPLLLDQISSNDPIWQTIIPEYLIELVDLPKLVDENPEYFHHQLGLCACFKCKCGRCKCDMSHNVKLRVNGTLLSIYGRDFQNRDSHDYNKLNQVNQLTYQTGFLNQPIMNLQSTQQIDFQGQQQSNVSKNERIDKTSLRSQGSMSNLTSYKSTYGSWGAGELLRFKKSHHVSTNPEIPFLGRTSYQDAFASTKNVASDYKNFKSQLSPIPSGPFFGTTTNQRAFAYYKQTEGSRSPQKEDVYQTPVFEGQFKTTFKRDFKGSQDDRCPAPEYKRAWKQKLFEKQNRQPLLK